MTLLNFEMQPFQLSRPVERASGSQDMDLDRERPVKPWTAYALLVVLLLLVICPQRSIIILCTNYYYIVRRSIFLLCFHLVVSYFLIFMMMSSLIVTLARDPGPIRSLETMESYDTSGLGQGQEGQEMSITEALLTDSSIPLKTNGEPRWCKKCWAPKPERAHHCSECNRCVLRMDHHCPWLANRCLGARTYPSFLHFLFSTTLYSAYQFGISIPAVWFYIGRPFIIDETDYTPFHALTLALLSLLFTFTTGSFFVYHVYLACTNQTTLEVLRPFAILSHLPPKPPEDMEECDAGLTDRDPSPPPFSSSPPSPTSTECSLPMRSPPPYAAAMRGRNRSRVFDGQYRFPSPPPPPTRRWIEHELNSKQRRLVREAACRIRIYDLGWKENIKQILGGPDPSIRSFGTARIWAERILWGGRGHGSGETFRHSETAELQLQELVAKLIASS